MGKRAHEEEAEAEAPASPPTPTPETPEGVAPDASSSALSALFSATAGGEAATPQDPKDVFKHVPKKRKKNPAYDRALVVYMSGAGKVIRPESEETEREKTTVFVDNLPNDTEKRELEQIFKKCCDPSESSKLTVRVRLQHFNHKKDDKGLFKTQKLNLIKGKLKDEGTCAAFVYLPSQTSYQKALGLNGSAFMEHHIRVEPCKGGPTPFESDTSLFLGNLLLELEEEELRNFVESKGVAVQKVRLIKDKVTRKGKGFGFVSFATQADANEAWKLINGQYLQGREVRAKRCQHRSQEKDDKLRKHRSEADPVVCCNLLFWCNLNRGHDSLTPNKKKLMQCLHIIQS